MKKESCILIRHDGIVHHAQGLQDGTLTDARLPDNEDLLATLQMQPFNLQHHP